MLHKEPTSFRVKVCQNCHPDRAFDSFGTCGWKHKKDACWLCGFSGVPKVVIVKKGDTYFDVYLARWKRTRKTDAK